MPRAPDGQYELVLENRQVVTIFFAIVILCGVFFGLGYIVGRNTMGYIPPAEPGLAAEGKKSAINPGGGEAKKEETAGPSASDLTYQKTLEGKTAPAQLETPPAAAASPGTAASSPPQPAPSGGAMPQPTAASGEVISLQVAALSKKEDAEALVGLLKKKGLPATLTTSPSDRLLRVQVGPFGSIKEAEEARSRLEQEGFRPITKK